MVDLGPDGAAATLECGTRRGKGQGRGWAAAQRRCTPRALEGGQWRGPPWGLPRADGSMVSASPWYCTHLVAFLRGPRELPRLSSQAKGGPSKQEPWPCAPLPALLFQPGSRHW